MEYTVYLTNRDATFDVDDRGVDSLYGAMRERLEVIQVSSITGKKVLVNPNQVAAVVAKAAR